MSLYIIEDRYGALRDSSVNYKYAKSLQQSKYPDGHIVEMVPAKHKVQVSQKEAKMLKKAKDTTVWRPAAVISEYAYNAAKDSDQEALLEDRLMRAYVNGYTVKKKYLVYKVLVDKQKHEYFAQAYQSTVNPGTVSWFLNSKVQSESLAQFTESEIERYGLQDCEKVWCDSDD